MELLKEFDVECVRADNPGPFTLDGSNCWLIGRDPCWIIDPGPPIDAHLDRLAGEAKVRGGVGGIAITHDHADHSGGLEGLLARIGDVPVGAAEMAMAGVTLADGDQFGPLSVYATPGHAPDHLAFVSGSVVFTGDAVLGRGSVYISPDDGALTGYLEALDHLWVIRRINERQNEAMILSRCANHGRTANINELCHLKRIRSTLAMYVREEWIKVDDHNINLINGLRLELC